MTNATRTPRYVQVNIGRNVGDVPMSDGEWLGFAFAVEDAILAAIAGDVPDEVDIHSGKGVWTDADGVSRTEQSAHLSVFADVDTFALRASLRTLKATYEQDAIALIVGSDLI